MNKISNSSFFGIFSTICLLALPIAFAPSAAQALSCGADACKAPVVSVYSTQYGITYVELGITTTPTNCTLNNGYYTIDSSNTDHSADWVSILLTSSIGGNEVTVRAEPDSSGYCEVIYVVGHAPGT